MRIGRLTACVALQDGILHAAAGETRRADLDLSVPPRCVGGEFDSRRAPRCCQRSSAPQHRPTLQFLLRGRLGSELHHAWDR